jgi:hypothetical protein
MKITNYKIFSLEVITLTDLTTITTISATMVTSATTITLKTITTLETTATLVTTTKDQTISEIADSAIKVVSVEETKSVGKKLNMFLSNKKKNRLNEQKDVRHFKHCLDSIKTFYFLLLLKLEKIKVCVFPCRVLIT